MDADEYAKAVGSIVDSFQPTYGMPFPDSSPVLSGDTLTALKKHLERSLFPFAESVEVRQHDPGTAMASVTLRRIGRG